MTAALRGLTVAAVLALAACATPFEVYDVDEFLDTPTPAAGSAFDRALVDEYKAYVRANTQGKNRWKLASKYAEKGLNVAQGRPAPPEIVATIIPASTNRCQALCLSARGDRTDWRVPEQHGPELEAARTQLMADFAAGAREHQPALAAKAQAAFDCWFEDVRSGNAPSACHDGLLAVEPQLRR